MPIHHGIDEQNLRRGPLAQVLKQEAEAERPAFSEDLYGRILNQVGIPGAERAHLSSSGKSRLSFKQIAWVVLATYASVVTVAILMQVVQRSGWFHRQHIEVSGIAGENLNEPRQEKGSGSDVNLVHGKPPTEAIEDLVSAPDRTIQQVQIALSEIDRQRWANLDNDLRLAGELLHQQLPWGVLSRAESSQVETP